MLSQLHIFLQNYVLEMNEVKKKRIAVVIILAVLFGMIAPVYAAESVASVECAVQNDISVEHQLILDTIYDTGNVLIQNNPQPKPGTIGGEWLILGVARSGKAVPENYYDVYYAALESLLKEKQGILHKRKYTEYSRTILALTAIGKDPTNVGGYNLLLPLGDYTATIKQGINGAVFALLALDSNAYTMPVSENAEVNATRQMYVDAIISKALPNGGWAMNGTVVDIDLTAMALQALAPYNNDGKVQAAIERGLEQLSLLQNAQGGYTVYGTTSSETTAQVIVALTSLGIDLHDERFVKQGNSTIDHLMTFYQPQEGFCHIIGEDCNAMATEQALYALVAAERQYAGKPSLYDMTQKTHEALSDTENAQEKQPSTLAQKVKQTVIQTVNNLLRKGA